MVGVLAALGISAWIYPRINRSSGGNTQTALIVSGIGGFFVFLFVVTLLGILFD